MNKETSFYIEILSDFINERKTNAVTDLNWQLLCDYAYIQNTNGIVFYQCKSFLPEDISKRLCDLYMAEIYSYGKRINLNREISRRLEEEKLTYCLVKGPVVALNYPVPALRTMGDSDFIVHEGEKEKAYEIMDELGFTLNASLNERVYYKNNMEVEIHHALTYKDEDAKEVNFSNRVWDYVKDNKLDISYHFVFLLLHIKKHILSVGVGFRQFMDLALIIKKQELDWNFINTEVEKLGLTKFKNTCLALTYEWFGVKSNEELTKLDPEFIEEVTIKLMKNGVQGFENEENNTNSAVKEITKNNQNVLLARIKYMLNLYFPPVSYFKNDVNYRFLMNRSYLLPVAWAYRFVLSIKNNNALFEIKRSIKGFFMSKKDLEEKKNKMDNWGL